MKYKAKTTLLSNAIKMSRKIKVTECPELIYKKSHN